MIKRLIRIFWRSPDLAIGEPEELYLLRWYVVRKNRFFGCFLHKFLADDYDRALHDHPWASVSILIRGQYVEITDEGRRVYRAPWVICRGPTHRHRVEMIDGKPAWTLFFTGPVVRVWGFWCPKGFVPWTDFVDPDNYGQVGKGCNDN